MVVLKFREYNDINEVQKFREKKLFVTRQNAVTLEKDEYFIADLIGLCVQSVEGRDLGVLIDVIQTGANDVYVVKKDGKELMIPAIHECVRNIDLASQKMTVYVMPGLEDL